MSADQRGAAWRVLADDLTGALDTAAVMGGGSGVPVFIGAPDPDAANADLSAVATASRDAAPASLTGLLSPSLDWLADAGLAYKKVDSLLRGNTFAELAWLQAWRPQRFGRIVFAPAYPAQGRFTRGDRHWAGLQSIDGLRQQFARHGLRALTGSTLDACLAGAGEGPAVLIPDVMDDTALDRIAAWSQQPQSACWLWAGSAGLAHALARRQVPISAAAELPSCLASDGLLLVTCSRHPVLREQLGRLQNHLPDGMDLLDLSASQDLSPDHADALLNTRARDLVARLPRPGLLLVVGGDTLLALCRASGARALTAGACAQQGWGQAVIEGGSWHGVTCLSRSGAFGSPHDLVELTARLMAAQAACAATPHPKESTV